MLFLKKIRLSLGQLFKKNKLFAFLLYASIFINLICFGFFYSLTKLNQKIIILHYNAFLKIDSIVDISQKENLFNLFLAPVIGLIIWLFNAFLSFIFHIQLSKIDRASGRLLTFEEINEIADNKKNDVNYFSIYLILGIGLFLQFALLIYTIAIWRINRL